MGMAHWTKEECRYFVDVIVPQSKYASGDHDHNAPGKSFGDLADEMQNAMTAIGIHKRTYTQSNMFQHYYQKVSARAHRRNESDVNNTALPAGAQPVANAPSSSAAGSSPQAGPSNAASGNKRKKDVDETKTEVDSDDEPLIKKKKSAVKATPNPRAKKAKKVVDESESEEEGDLPRPPNHLIHGPYGDLEWDAMEFCRAREKAAKAARKAVAAALAAEGKEKKKSARKSGGAGKKGKGKAVAVVVAVESETEKDEPVARPAPYRPIDPKTGAILSFEEYEKGRKGRE
ncbi:hypothetical protein B0J14DRAFT_558076 [Halenospora varia]|nr:hypothetical protein B0J14DRAFT_558076 [Halenospora varia]